MPTDTAIAIGTHVLPAAVTARAPGARKPVLDAFGVNERATAQDASYVLRMLSEAGASGREISLHVDPHKAATNYDGVLMAAVAEGLAAWGAAPAAPPGVVFAGSIAGASQGLRFTAALSTLPVLFALAERSPGQVVVVPDDAAWMAAWVPELDLRTCATGAALRRALEDPAGVLSLPKARKAWVPAPRASEGYFDVAFVPELARPFAVAAAGAHHLALVTRPVVDGRGLAALAGLLPPLTPREAREVLTVQSLAGMLHGGAPREVVRPFRAPHHDAEASTLAGVPGRPGELTLADLGVLALNDVDMMRQGVIDDIAEAARTGAVTTARMEWQIDWPARFLLVGIAAPCPCGYMGCTCTSERRAGFRKRLQPRMDKLFQIAAHVESARPVTAPAGPSSAALQATVTQARDIAMARQGKLNGALTAAETLRLAPGMGAPWHVLRVARTLADLAGGRAITRADVDEARSYDVARAFDAR